MYITAMLQALGEESEMDLKIEALPLVGEGHTYRRRGIATLGPAKNMPSGGFIYMDLSQLIGDVRAGLLSLVLEQVVAGSLKLLKLAKFSSCHINI